MSDTAIKVEGLGKQYIIGHKKQGDLRYALGDKIKGLFKPDASEKEIFWALKDINFEIKHGEAVGIIGRNGAGKSTLLKILSRITEPSTGRFTINGRVSSLLEVGTGFHMELTGRENIYLNGTILGMKRAEIRQKFDEIVDFSGVEKFLDTPVKHYSSGMKVRLAFSVAAHLEPEILIVDEVLAVGDAEFQKKCLGKMDQVSKNEGRTVVFVSHNMGAVQNLCSRGILIKEGKLKLDDRIETVINEYKRYSFSDLNGKKYISDSQIREGRGIAKIQSIEIIENGENVEFFTIGSNAVFRLKIENNSQESLKNVEIAVGVDDSLNNRIIHLSNYFSNHPIELIPGKNTIDINIQNLPLMEGRYSLTFFMTTKDILEDWLKDIFTFDVETGDFYHNGRLPRLGKAQFLLNHNYSIC
ncbi:ABC transporter ATP-binding protein [Marivirga lumbricoides]|uniref:ABC transporter ATP-binding protein n=1 Tax=Marivirga lumbricoides TaxID=1046115 RepID=A0ABQ1MTL1_9BACT|nr:ABC transporter ATP-binding protein [Marivirga lumbricoides]